MIPLFAIVRVRGRRHRFGIWIPLLLVWLLLLPIALLLLPFFFIACMAAGIDSFGALAAGWQTLTGLRGTHIEATDGDLSFVVAVH